MIHDFFPSDNKLHVSDEDHVRHRCRSEWPVSSYFVDQFLYAHSCSYISLKVTDRCNTIAVIRTIEYALTSYIITSMLNNDFTE